MAVLGQPRKHDYEDIARFWRTGENHRLTQEALADAYYQKTGHDVPLSSLARIIRNNPNMFTLDGSGE